MKPINIAIIGLGQIGNFLYYELNKKKSEIELKTGKKIKIVAVSAKNKNKKRKYPIQKNIFFNNPMQIFKNVKVDILSISIARFRLCFLFLNEYDNPPAPQKISMKLIFFIY